MPVIALGAIVAGGTGWAMWVLCTLLGLCGPTEDSQAHYMFHGSWPTGQMAQPPLWTGCPPPEIGGAQTVDNHRCTLVDYHPNLTLQACKFQQNYSNSLPGLPYKNNATCTDQNH
jgi:hypothetical protein